MSRHGYIEDDGYGDPFDQVRWQGIVARAIRGKRGQALLRKMREALDAMPDKRLIAGTLAEPRGVCALGAVAQHTGVDVSDLDPEDAPTVAKRFDIAESLAREVAYVNDAWVTVPRSYMIKPGRWRNPATGEVLRFRGQEEPPEGDGWEWYPEVRYEPTPSEIEQSERRRWEMVSRWVDLNLKVSEP